MGLTVNSTGRGAVSGDFDIKKSHSSDKVIALAGNPNVGKSSIFNSLTGMHQHTGNWPGKTVTNARGICTYNDTNYIFVDIPGTYSLLAHSAEEEVARDFICFGNPDATVVVCDATCLERNMNLVLQILEVNTNVIVCVNLMDEAKKKNIEINLDMLSKQLGVPFIGTSAAKGIGLDSLMQAIAEFSPRKSTFKIKYTRPIEDALAVLEPAVAEKTVGCRISPRRLALNLLDGNAALIDNINKYLGFNLEREVAVEYTSAKNILDTNGITAEKFRDTIVSCIVLTAEYLCMDSVKFGSMTRSIRDEKIDRLLTGKRIGYPIMILLLGLVFWITIAGANYPSSLLTALFGKLEAFLLKGCEYIGMPDMLRSMLVLGVYKVLAWVVAVMLPPMAIFFPLFTLLEDLGYLPRVAFNLDKILKKCNACGKQSLTMCMGFGCNAAGIVGCRIIDSPRERLIAMLTNSFVPCNGRFPTIIAVISMFFVCGSGMLGSVLSALILTLVIMTGIGMTFLSSKLLSSTILRGEPSSYTLELPPYRKPAIGSIIVRSIFDRTVFVLGRAAAVAAPAGLIIWIAANVNIGNSSLLLHCCNFFDPLGRMLGMDGVIIMAFILGLPANEIVMPLIIMAYTAGGTLVPMDNLTSLHGILTANGWTPITAVCTILFSLMHWPCSTTCLTVYKETRSIKWTLAAFFLPTAAGAAVCFITANIARLFM